ncbi:uncharacterized protein A1O9_13142 [Exophiala aquamarina CBS 119918]|uniref:F-box domain-containing protein n=1 Tax=Exophiala aquamarina CBS 119918 TaxID=1182545 RepID=A0A072NT84_9EURO|nr:uncharacterized protein A1O9_13142 [Exophiala aquamarina CBS 119918]KEF50806.1 hypothetical protein A1O9_13142 [Exophiala aquamarina CBS 119918]
MSTLSKAVPSHMLPPEILLAILNLLPLENLLHHRLVCSDISRAATRLLFRRLMVSFTLAGLKRLELIAHSDLRCHVREIWWHSFPTTPNSALIIEQLPSVAGEGPDPRRPQNELAVHPQRGPVDATSAHLTRDVERVMGYYVRVTWYLFTPSHPGGRSFRDSASLMGNSTRLAHPYLLSVHASILRESRWPVAEMQRTCPDLVPALICMRYLLQEDRKTGCMSETPTSDPLAVPRATASAEVGLSPGATGPYGDVYDIQNVYFLQDENLRDPVGSHNAERGSDAYQYAARYWTDHYARVEGVLDTWVVEDAITLLTGPTGARRTWYDDVAYHSQMPGPRADEANAIILAAFFGLARALQTLLQQPPEQQTGASGPLALYWASSEGHSKCVDILLGGHLPPATVEQLQSALAVAIQAGSWETCELLLEKGRASPNHGARWCRTPPLVLAAKGNQQEILRGLMGRVDILLDQVDGRGRTALMEACHAGATECVHTLLEDGRPTLVATDAQGRNALVYAIQSGLDNVLRPLLAHPGIDVHQIDRGGRNSVSHAAQHGHLEVVMHLVHADVAIGAEDITGRNAISWAANSSEATRRGSDLSLLTYLVRTCPVAVDAHDECGWSALAWALDPPGHLQTIQVLIEQGRANVNQRDTISGRSILASAAGQGHAEIVRYLLRSPNIDKNGRDWAGRSPLSHAAGQGMVATIEVLLQDREVVLDLQDERGRTPMDWARRSNHQAAVAQLAQASSGTGWI